MTRLQEAYDNCTRVGSSIRMSSQKLFTLVSPTSLQAQAPKACLQSARRLEPFCAKMESILFSSEETSAKPDDIRSLLCDAAPLYKEVENAEQHLVQVVLDEEKKVKKAQNLAKKGQIGNGTPVS